MGERKERGREEKRGERKKEQRTGGQGQADGCSLNIFISLDLLDLVLYTLQDFPCASCQSWSTVSCLFAHV